MAEDPMGVEAALVDFERLNDALGQTTWVNKGPDRAPYRPIALPTFRQLRDDEYTLITVRCECREPVGQVGVPAKGGAGLVSVQWKCPACGKTGWWRSAPRHI